MKKPILFSIAALLVAGLITLQMTDIIKLPFGETKKSKILGAGASFPYPLYTKMFREYKKKTKVEVNYQSIGSGAGVRQLLVETVDFASVDSFLTKKDLANAKSQLIHIPIALGGIAVAYNVDGLSKLKLDGETLAKIFMGKITKWNDPEITKINPEVKLPDKTITVIRRSDSSSTTYAFSSFLAFASMSWQKDYGISKTIKWFESSLGAKGNEGVAGQIKNIPYSVGYIGLNYAKAIKVPVAYIKNFSGNFIKPTIQTVYEAAKYSLPDDTLVNLSSTATIENGYPISSFNWVIVKKEQKYQERTKEQARELQDLLAWMVLEGQKKYAESLHYAPLPSEAISKSLKIIASIEYNGKPLQK